MSALQAPGDRLPLDVERIIDADGMIVMPGAVDPHCHVDTEVGGYRTRDDYAGASEAALWGGTTSIIDFAIPLPGQSPLEAARGRMALAEKAHCNVGIHGCVINWTDDTEHQLNELAALGVRTIKLFTTYRDVLMASPDTVLRVIRTLRNLGGLAYVHAESNHLIEAVHAERTLCDEMDAEHHARTRPENTEVAAVNEVISIAESLGAHVYFVHQSTPSAVQAVTSARARGVRAYSETCPHYLLLSEELYDQPEPERFVCCPPLRSHRSVEGLRELAVRGEVHTVGSDHNCFDMEQKLENRDDVRKMPNGLPGVEMRVPIMYSEFVEARGLAPTRLVELLCTNPAKLNGMYPRKGVIAVGSDADIVILDPSEVRKVAAESLHMRSDYSPYDGVTVTGWPRTVIVSGHVVIDDGEWQKVEGVGRFVGSNRFDHDRLV